MRFFINESRFLDIQDDVDLVYNKFFKKDIDAINSGVPYNSQKMFLNITSNTTLFKNGLLKQAHEAKPCIIEINNSDYGNGYIPKMTIISFSVNSHAIGFFDEGEKLDDAVERLDTEQVNNFLNEFSEHKMKGSIHHELIHWLDNALHNNTISNFLDKSNKKGLKKYIRKDDVYLSYIETHSILGNIKQLKNKFNDIWDSLTFEDMIHYSPFLTNIYKRFSDENKYKFKKTLLKRMHRAGLLGKYMR